MDFFFLFLIGYAAACYAAAYSVFRSVYEALLDIRLMDDTKNVVAAVIYLICVGSLFVGAIVVAIKNCY